MSLRRTGVTMASPLSIAVHGVIAQMLMVELGAIKRNHIIFQSPCDRRVRVVLHA